MIAIGVDRAVVIDGSLGIGHDRVRGGGLAIGAMVDDPVLDALGVITPGGVRLVLQSMRIAIASLRGVKLLSQPRQHDKSLGH